MFHGFRFDDGPQLRVHLLDKLDRRAQSLPVDDVLGRAVPGAGRGADGVHLKLDDLAVQAEDVVADAGQPGRVALRRSPGPAAEEGGEEHIPLYATSNVDHAVVEVSVPLEEGTQ